MAAQCILKPKPHSYFVPYLISADLSATEDPQALIGNLNSMFSPYSSRVLFLMTKSGYQPPRLKEKGKW